MSTRAAISAPLFFLSSLALSATFTVTNTNTDGAGSLRQAIIDANAAAGPPHIVEFDSSLTGSITPVAGVSGLPALAVSMSIIGPDKGEVTINLDKDGPLTINAGVSLVSITGLAIAGGTAPRGGCLSNAFGAELVLTDMEFSFCVASATGALGAEGGAVFSTGPTEINSSRFTSNFALGGSNGPGLGGAVYVNPGQNQVSISNSEFVANATSIDSETGAIFSSGGAVYQQSGDLNISGSRFAFNAADESGDGNKDANGGAITHNGDEIIVRSTTFASNSANGAGSAVQIFNTGSGFNNNAFIENVVFYDNRGNLGGRQNNGAALSVGRSTLSLRNSTFFANSSTSGASSLFHSIDLDNLAISNNAFGQSADGSTSCRSVSNPDDVFAGSFNFFTDASCNWLASAGSQQTSLGLLLIGENSTFASPAILPVISSPLVDAGSTSTSQTDFSVCAETDFNAMIRPIDNNGDAESRCTAGAYEQVVEDELFSDQFIAP